MAGRFEGQSFVITGGTNGIGLGTARRIVTEGGRVLVTGRNPERLAAAEAIEGVHAIANDAADPAAAPALAQAARDLFGTVDGVFLNAGMGVISPLSDITEELYRKQFDLNVGGVLFGAQALAPVIKQDGCMLLMASGVKTKGIPGAILYAGSKGAVRSIAMVLARELKPQGIRVNTISPGPIETDFHGPASNDPGQAEEIAELLRAMIPLGRMGRLEEAVAVATFLLSNEATFVTGADYPVDGGEAQL
ncbi:SDR family NAD(P)-dependent oxidoreductase [Croceicoccus bisphenolivorans]|uniref:SDR family NAD(P)-dependent oxidoreductase n=1 Tax=Croceicoccus bisphenolivorans TaxID=1783232 RepID=UPI000834E7A5|nr:SDR family oxidoreductase [Croceicoccus bisphenolivorans]